MSRIPLYKFRPRLIAGGGDGGVPQVPWSPASDPNVVAYWNVGETGGLTGSGASSVLVDLSGNGLDLSAVGDPDTANSNYIALDANDSYLTSSWPLPPSSNPEFAVIVLFECANINTGTVTRVWEQSLGSGSFAGSVSSDSSGLQYAWRYNGGYNATTGPGADATAQLLVWARPAASTYADSYIRKDGVLLTGFSSNNPTFTPSETGTDFRLGNITQASQPDIKIAAAAVTTDTSIENLLEYEGFFGAMDINWT